jgi:hypothetical protein
MKCVILQPSYIPWRGYFDQIRKADIFVFYDDVQYDKRGWRNRNRIKTTRGQQWLTIPVYSKGAQTENIPIKDIRIVWDTPWNKDHWKSIQQAYKKAPYFERYANFLESLYDCHPDFLADFTIELTIALARELGIKNTQFLRSSQLHAAGHKTDRLINILLEINATEYLSGPSAQEYIEEYKFKNAHITLEYMAYNYPEYPQLYPPYDPQVTILDLMFMVGPDSLKYITGEVNA